MYRYSVISLKSNVIAKALLNNRKTVRKIVLNYLLKNDIIR